MRQGEHGHVALGHFLQSLLHNFCSDELLFLSLLDLEFGILSQPGFVRFSSQPGWLLEVLVGQLLIFGL